MTAGSLLVIGILLLLFLVGPRIKIDTTIHSVHLPEDLNSYLATSEARFPDLTTGTEKTIIWANEDQKKTDISVVYLHGFSATRQETAPLPELVARQLGANLYYTRFTGHGRADEAMVDCSVNSWLNDGNEAIEIGKRLGNKVIVLGVSTGATAATWLAAQQHQDKIAALIFMSPNFGLCDSRSFLLSWPWGKQIAELIIGSEFHWEPSNELHQRFWTCRFPTRALLPMKGLVNLAQSLDYSVISTPTQILYSPADEVVRPEAIVTMFNKLGSTKKELIAYTDSEAPKQHILAGDILAPASTAPVAEIILRFCKRHIT